MTHSDKRLSISFRPVSGLNVTTHHWMSQEQVQLSAQLQEEVLTGRIRIDHPTLIGADEDRTQDFVNAIQVNPAVI